MQDHVEYIGEVTQILGVCFMRREWSWTEGEGSEPKLLYGHAVAIHVAKWMVSRR